jgi:rhodanese-related sulfurtransferase
MTFATAWQSPNAWKALISARFPDVRWVDAKTLQGWMSGPGRRDLVLVDVRKLEEQEVSQLRGAQHLDPLRPDVATLKVPQDATVVVYCSIGYRSAAIVEEMERAGIRNVYNLEGGLFDWANQDRPIYRGEERVETVHPFNRLWGLLLRKDRRAAR